MKSKKIYYPILLFILILIFVQPFNAFYKNTAGFFSRNYHDRYGQLEKAYYSSQYVNKINPGIMPDQALEAFAGGIFIKGMNPILIIHDQPPLGRYIIGLSILLFDNDSTLILPLLLLSVFGIFLIAKCTFNNTLLSLVPVGIFINEPIFLSKLEVAPLLETIQLTFIIFSLYFFIEGVTKAKYTRYFILTAIMLGFVISIRFFILGAVLTFSMILYFLFRKKIDRRLIVFFLSLPLSLVILIASYIKTIQAGYSIFQIFAIQKYILFYHKSKLVSLFFFWDLIILNRWHTWWGDRRILSDSQWVIVWPVSMVLNFLALLLTVIKRIKLNEPEKIILLWVISYCAFLSIGNSTTRYFLPLLPFLYIMGTSFLLRIGRAILKNL